MLIGGLALSAWGIPRATLDVDLTLWVSAERLDEICLSLASDYVPRVSAPVAFVHRTRVLPLATAQGVRVDFIFAAFPFEKNMIDRATVRPVGNVPVRVASLEDLVLLKLPSPRAKDEEDIRVILENFRDRLDWEYLLGVAEMLSDALGQPSLAGSLRMRRPYTNR
jgi:predicted nucleotidyltransferase